MPPQLETISACQLYPCGSNAVCRESSGGSTCTCLPDYYGNPYEGCRPECLINSDCLLDKTCIRNKCQDSCPGTCGQNTMCQVINHLPTCTCIPGYSGNPFQYCSLIQDQCKLIVGICYQSITDLQVLIKNTLLLFPLVIQDLNDPCNLSPCGPNSQCHNNNSLAICSCLPTFVGSPPICRPECTVSSECQVNLACINQKCVDPCQGICGIGAQCRTIFHSPHCSCNPGQTGDPFVKCFEITRELIIT